MRLSIGSSIIIDKDLTENSEKYKSKVVDLGPDYFMIDYPIHMETDRTAFFMDGTQLLVTFVDQHKMSYAFRTEVKGRMNRGIPMLQLSYPGDQELVKIQRREYVRVETPIDVAVNDGRGFDQYVAEDISAGGIALHLGQKEEFEENQRLSLFIALPFLNDDIYYVRAEAIAVRTWEKDGRRLASLQFVETMDADRQHIIRFCFERQLQRRKEAL
ncbi:flagellar brake protein [Sporosarcina cyprini]|uniref:flagellar brake protein n=1 Tax=Sporosarcina cyprini TaxID=2910523 RepID=UPI001EDD7C0A|nr:flagellar brake domain-containing protein [Sporosarcina cyprini]MCG3089961.1 flagellar brake domain-containing protein [Sporosarcina cyprini]